MKKTKTILLGICVVLGLAITSCTKDNFFVNNIKGKGSIIEQSRSEMGFSGVDLCIDADVIITPSSDNYSIVIEAQQNIADNIELKVRNGVLQIGYHRNVRSHLPITIRISMPMLTEANISGSGSVSTNGLFYSSIFSSDISGSGNLNLQIETSDADFNLSGSGKITLTGKTQNANYNISGSGDVNALSFPSLVVDADISGSGNISVDVQNKLNVSISGSGNVNYKGTPAVSADMSGSGKINSI